MTDILPGHDPDPLEPAGDDGAVGDGTTADDAFVYLPPHRSALRRAAPVLGGLVLAALLVVGSGAWWISRQVNPPNAPGKAVTVSIPDGSSDSQIATVLAAHGVVTNADVFRYYVKLTSAGPFKAGIYDGLHAPESMSEVVKRLNRAPLPPPTRTLVIPEGLWLSEIRTKILATFPEMKPADLDKALATVHSKYQPPGSTNLEGFLFPATYQVLLTDVADPQKLVAQMVTKFDQEADSLNLTAGAKASGLTPYQVLTVASMVQEEAKVPTDAPKIARVIYNRLGKNMSLGLDTTVEYALQQRIVNITNAQLATPSPYNTRLHAGLPPTPISSPGRAAIEAALNPAPGDWIYFVLAAPDGSQYFTASYSDFQRATAKAKAEGLFGGVSAPTGSSGRGAVTGSSGRGAVTGATQVAAVIGDPIRHSRSPQILNAAFEAVGLDWVYVALPVAAGGAPAALEAVRTCGLSGLSVTMPHKTAVADHLDTDPDGELSDTARRLRAVNCVVVDGSRLVGHNTDGAGFLASARADADFDPAGRRVAVLGAGGAARALVLALAGAHAAEVVVINRTPSRAAEAAALAGSAGRVGEPGDVASMDLVVNATSVGMDGRSLPVDPAGLHAGQLVADIVMQPLDTPWLVAARAQGASGLGGLGMLVHQAAVAFELWTGRPAPLDVMVRAAQSQ